MTLKKIELYGETTKTITFGQSKWLYSMFAEAWLKTAKEDKSQFKNQATKMFMGIVWSMHGGKEATLQPITNGDFQRFLEQHKKGTLVVPSKYVERMQVAVDDLTNEYTSKSKPKTVAKKAPVKRKVAAKKTPVKAKSDLDSCLTKGLTASEESAIDKLVETSEFDKLMAVVAQQAKDNAELLDMVGDLKDKVYDLENPEG
jgi:hypothetical protein